MENREGNAKGSLYIYSKEFIIYKHGYDGWNKIIGILSDKELEILDKVTIFEWFPVKILNRIYNYYDSTFGSGDLSSISQIAEYIAKNDLKQIFEMFVNLKNPSFVLQNVPSLWNRYFDTGKVTISIADEENKHYQFILEDETEEQFAPNKAICKHGTTAWLRTALQMIGIVSVSSTHPQCRYNGNSYCITDIKWD